MKLAFAVGLNQIFFLALSIRISAARWWIKNWRTFIIKIKSIYFIFTAVTAFLALAWSLFFFNNYSRIQNRFLGLSLISRLRFLLTISIFLFCHHFKWEDFNQVLLQFYLLVHFYFHQKYRETCFSFYSKKDLVSAVISFK